MGQEGNLDGEKPHCDCPDHQLRGGSCKHILAVKLVIQRELFEDGTEQVTETVTVTETVRKIYCHHDPFFFFWSRISFIMKLSAWPYSRTAVR